jgi:hypothetical protein
VHLQRFLVEVGRQRIGTLDDEILGGVPDAGGIDGLKAEGAGEVVGEPGVGADRGGVLEGVSLALALSR